MIAEGNETPQGSRGEPAHGSGGGEGRGRGGEADLLAERRARRAAEAPEHVLTLRAEAAEATVRTLESHLATVQQRLREAETETRRLHETLVAEAGSRERGAGEGSGRTGLLERELQRARQREQAEHRARVEAEDRADVVERDDRVEIDRLVRRLSANERFVRAIAAQLQDLERRLLEAEERAREGQERERSQLHARLATIERSAVEVAEGLTRERAQREQAERVLASMRRGQRRVENVVRELAAIATRLRTQVSEPSARAIPPPPGPLPGSAELAGRSGDVGGAPAPPPASSARPARSVELESALAAAAERLRDRAEENAKSEDAAKPPAGGASQGVAADAHQSGGPEDPPAAALAAAPAAAAASAPRQPTHKASMSLIGRIRRARKQRRERR